MYLQNLATTSILGMSISASTTANRRTAVIDARQEQMLLGFCRDARGASQAPPRMFAWTVQIVSPPMAIMASAAVRRTAASTMQTWHRWRFRAAGRRGIDRALWRRTKPDKPDMFLLPSCSILSVPKVPAGGALVMRHEG